MSDPAPRLTRVFAVLDPERMMQPALEKAEWVAARNDAVLHMYCCVYDTQLAFQEESQAALVDEARRWVERLADRPRARGLAVEIQIESKPDWRKAIVRAATESGAELVVKSSSPHGALRRRLSETSDWVLLRESPSPVLLVTPFQPSNTKVVLAAVKLKPEGDVYSSLNERVIDLSHRVADALGADLHAVTVYKGDDIYFDRQRFADSCRLPRNRVHSTDGAPYKGIAELAARLNAGVVIVGCARAPRDSIIGDTAQRVVDEVRADVVVLPAA